MQSLLQCPVCRLTLRSPSTLVCGHSQCARHPDPCPLCASPPHGIHDVVLTNIQALHAEHKDFEQELTCHICYQLFFQPCTIVSCQHSFCAKCLQRALDHSPSCPICRTPVPPLYFQSTPPNATLLAILLHAYPAPYHARATALDQEERLARLSTPIFVCQLSFPGVPTILHFFEPRYRLMLRRCLRSPSPRFGMVTSPKPGAPHSDYGTILEIKSVQILPDGRSVVQTFGSSRFRILERASLDGYMVARIETVDDIQLDLPSQPSNQDLISSCKAFLARLKQGAAPWVVQRLSSTYGAMPSDPALFSFWVALILPIEEQEKAKLLPIKSPRLRLIMVVSWIERLNRNWSVLHSFIASLHSSLSGGSQTAAPYPNSSPKTSKV
jgi:Lon protease-like protein